MTKRWKLKTTSSNILLVLITLILVKAEWVKEENDSSWESTNAVESINNENQIGHTHTYVGNDEIADYYFHSSINNETFILDGVNKCLDSFQLITCVKMLLLSRVNDVLSLIEEPEVAEKDIRLFNGVLIFKIKNDTNTTGFSEINDSLSLDDEITVKVRKIFRNRSLMVNLLPKVRIEIEPTSGRDGEDFLCFRFSKELSQSGSQDEGRKRKSGGMSMMMVPPLIMLGLMPFTLASLKAMVMNAVMINMMALNGAIFMTIRNLVFGPRHGDNVKYVNYGYSKDRQTQSRKPVLIIHSPAAFVKQPPVHKKQVYGPSSHHSAFSYFPQSHYSNVGSTYHQANGDDSADYYYVQQDESFHNRRQQGNVPGWRNQAKVNATRDVKVQNKNIYQRKYTQVNDWKWKAPSSVQTFGGSSYKTIVDVKETNQVISQRRGPDKDKVDFKPSPQWDSVTNEVQIKPH